MLEAIGKTKESSKSINIKGINLLLSFLRQNSLSGCKQCSAPRFWHS